MNVGMIKKGLGTGGAAYVMRGYTKKSLAISQEKQVSE